MKKSVSLIVAATTILFATSAMAEVKGQSKVEKVKFDRDYISCSTIAQKKARDFSDAMYLGIFYGCMEGRGYDVSTLM